MPFERTIYPIRSDHCAETLGQFLCFFDSSVIPKWYNVSFFMIMHTYQLPTYDTTWRHALLPRKWPQSLRNLFHWQLL